MRTKLFTTTIILFGFRLILGQDCGKIIISNAQRTDPAFIASVNGVRLNNDYAQTVTYKFLDENTYRVKILQAGSSAPLSFTISNEARYVSSYLLLKDNLGIYSLLLQSKTLNLGEKEPEPAVTTPAAVVVAPAATVAVSPPGATTSTVSQAPAYQAPVAMSTELYNRKLNEVKSKSFDDDKLERLKEAFEEEDLSTNQVIGLLKLFSFDDKRLEAAKFAYPRTVDQSEFYRVYDHFTFASYKTQLKDWIAKNKKK